MMQTAKKPEKEQRDGLLSLVYLKKRLRDIGDRLRSEKDPKRIKELRKQESILERNYKTIKSYEDRNRPGKAQTADALKTAKEYIFH